MPRRRKALAEGELTPVADDILNQFVREGPLSPEELDAAVRRFKKAVIERALGAELTHHLGYRTNRRVKAWYSEVADQDIFLSALTIGEVRRGVDRIARRDAKSAAVLERCLRGLVKHFAERILPVDHAIAEAWGRMNVPDPLPVIDGLLAATASVHGLTLVTRNTRHVARTGVSCLNPFLPGP